jgi:DNA-directed RNA polymerase subunit RPC12/RpoP
MKVLACGVLVLAGAALAVWALVGDRAGGRARCPECACVLEGVTGLRCPECGHVVWSAQEFYHTRRHWGLAAAGAVIAVGATMWWLRA